MIEDAIARADLNGSIAELRNLSSVLAAHNEDDIVAEINVLIAEFENIRDNVSSALVNIVVSLHTIQSLIFVHGV